MSSSDSEDDCYSNAALKLKKMKNTYKEDILQTTNLLEDSTEIDEIVKNAEIAAKPQKPAPKKRGRKAADPPPAPATIATEISAEIPAKNPPATNKRMTRSAARKSVQEPVVETPSALVAPPSAPVEASTAPLEPPTTPAETATPPVGSTRGRRGNRGNTSQNRAPRGRRRGGRWVQSSLDGMLDNILAGGSRGRSPRRGGSPRRGRGHFGAAFSFLNSIQTSMPIYSVGNTHEYPDECHDQQLFSSKPSVAKKDDDVVEIDANDSLDDNEELSVKVYWQSSEFFRFNIRKYQKITQIFDYFSKKENVSFGNLLFTFDDKILKPDDTPESIDYNIGKFIDGGVVNKNVSELGQKDGQRNKGGVTIKFQCQNVKKPFELSVFLDETLSVAMLKCAEHFEKSVDQLKFYFDGDVILGSSTARELELEGGECIDVKILS